MKPRANFADPPAENCRLENSQIVVIPAPYDGTSTWLKGADKGPKAIIDASTHMELYDIETDSKVFLRGIYTDKPVDGFDCPEEMSAAVEKAVSAWIEKGKFPVVVGGEHSVSIGSIRAHTEHYQDLTVLQLDAHTDLRDEYEGSNFNHACVMAHARRQCPIVQVGIRSMDAAERSTIEPDSIFFARDIYDNHTWIDRAVAALSEKVYITIDLDVFDPAIMPSTGTPEPGGLGWYEVCALLKAVAGQRKVVGFDVVELCPNDQNKAPDFLAAKLIYKLLSCVFKD